MNELIENKILPFVSKPGRYIGAELNSIHKNHSGKIRVALSYPDTYEIGMSNLGLSILYHILNKRSDIAAERVYAPWPDMEEKLKEFDVPLFSLESRIPVKDFDIIGFSIQNELTYTNLLNMLFLAKIPLRRHDRDVSYPLIIAGGASTCNPEPLSDFIDAFVIGDGEEVILEIADVFKRAKEKNTVKKDLLRELSRLEGVYAPGVNNFSDIKRRIVKDINTVDYPVKPIVPYIEIVHDRATIEIMRGCPRRCKFCQAGSVNKPVRLLKSARAASLAKETIKNTGFEEVSLVSLSSSDYPWLGEVVASLEEDFSKKRISLSLPSVRADNFSGEISKKMHSIRKSGITLAPEAGTQRLRDYICKDLTEEEILNSIKLAFSGGANRVKLYFMIGLPTETEEDIKGIVDLSYKIIGEAKQLNRRAKITVNVSTFIPKKCTPFENEQMIPLDEIIKKQNFLKENLKHKSIELRWHDAKMSVVEGMFSAGGRELGEVLYCAFKLGAKLDNWTEYFDYSKWEAAFAAHKNKIQQRT